MKKLFIILFIVLTFIDLNAQQTVFEEGQTIYNKESAGGVLLHSNSWGVEFYKANYLNGFAKIQYLFELVGMKSPRQYKVPIDNGGYYYGKLNSMIILRTSIGYMKEFIPKQSIKGVSLNYIFNIGLSSGFAKPVYLQIKKDNDHIVDEKYDPDIHNTNNIVGKSYPFVGLDQTKYYPGLYLRGALNFDYGRKSHSVRAIEVGLSADIFFQGIPIMAYEDPHRYFLTAFVGLTFGKRKFAGQTKENEGDFNIGN